MNRERPLTLRLAVLGLGGSALLLGACGGSTEESLPPIQTSAAPTTIAATSPSTTQATTTPSTTEGPTTTPADLPATSPCLPAAEPIDGVEYRVFNVADDDVLNIRQFPGHTTAKIGALGPTTSGLRPTGNCQMVGTGVWWELDTGDAGAWVNSKFLTPES